MSLLPPGSDRGAGGAVRGALSDRRWTSCAVGEEGHPERGFVFLSL